MARLDTDLERVATHDGPKWRVVLHGRYDSQEEAWAVAQWAARRLGRESLLRGLSGRWRKRNTHGNDPSSTRN